MICKKCGSDDMSVVSEQAGSKTGVKSAGCLWGFGRLFLIGVTFGLWLIIGKRKETGHTKFTYRTVALCQKCGNRQNV